MEWMESYPNPSGFPPSGVFRDEGISPVQFYYFMENTKQSVLSAEFKSLPTPYVRKGAEVSRRNPTKNRYADIPCLDATRVVLNDQMPGDYIHASHVDGYKQENAYILAQGPKENTVVDFWRMIWEEKVLVSVAVTRMVEDGGNRCNAYWPQIEHQVNRYGPFVVRNAQSVMQGQFYWVVSLLNIRKINSGEPIRNLYHIHYLDWRDKSVPSDLKGLFKVLDLIHDRQSLLMHQFPNWKGHPLGPPILVHCSAGLGRSATLVTLDICTRRLLSARFIDIKKTVEKVRQQRHGSIQTTEQYILIYVALLTQILNLGMTLKRTIDLSQFWDMDTRAGN